LKVKKYKGQAAVLNSARRIQETGEKKQYGLFLDSGF